jgi:hypothetical protein
MDSDSNWVSGADGMKLARREGSVQPERGAKTKPIRKRGYYRALKRGETWAVLDFQMRCSARRVSLMFYREMLEAIKTDIPIVGLADFVGG